MLPTFLNSVRSFALARALMSAIELDLFPILHREPLSRSELKRRLEIADTDIADSFLDILIASEFIRNDSETLHLTPLSESVLPVYDSIRGWNQEMLMFFRSLPELTDVLRTGQFETTELAHYWTYKQSSDRVQLDRAQVSGYSSAMDASQRQLAAVVAEQHDFSVYDHVIDFGGGYAQLALTLAEKYPKLRITVADLPAVCEEARARVESAGLGSRVNLLPIDFFTDELPEHVADAILFVRVLHDWNDEQVRQLLQRTRRCLGAAGTIIIVEPILPSRDMPDAASAQTSLMLSLMGGKRRSVLEYDKLLRTAGFAGVAWRDGGLSMYKLITAHKTETVHA